jgi:hypothetical protein
LNYLGIDPGLGGALGLIDANGKFVGLWDVPVIQVGKGTRRVVDGVALFLLLQQRCAFAIPFLEKVGGLPRQSAPAAFNFGYGYGLIVQGLHALRSLDPDRFPVHYQVTPQAWKKNQLAGTDKSKGAAILRAKEIFPGAARLLTRKKDHGRAEALLLAEYGRQRRLR